MPGRSNLQLSWGRRYWCTSCQWYVLGRNVYVFYCHWCSSWTGYSMVGNCPWGCLLGHAECGRACLTLLPSFSVGGCSNPGSSAFLSYIRAFWICSHLWRIWPPFSGSAPVRQCVSADIFKSWAYKGAVTCCCFQLWCTVFQVSLHKSQCSVSFGSYILYVLVPWEVIGDGDICCDPLIPGLYHEAWTGVGCLSFCLTRCGVHSTWKHWSASARFVPIVSVHQDPAAALIWHLYSWWPCTWGCCLQRVGCLTMCSLACHLCRPGIIVDLIHLLNYFQNCFIYFLAHLSTKCSVSFCDPSMSGVHRPSVRASVRACVRQQFL